MNKCSFDNLLKFLDKQLDLDGRLDLFDHLDHCDNCRDAIYQILRDRDSMFFVAGRRGRVQKAVGGAITRRDAAAG